MGTIDNQTALFYECMNYPLPNQEVLDYLQWSQADTDSVIDETFHYEPELCALYSREGEKSELLSDYMLYIE